MPDAPNNLQAILMKMSERLAAIEQSLRDRACLRHEEWLAGHEKRIRLAEIKISVMWIALIVSGGLIGYWVEALLQ